MEQTESLQNGISNQDKLCLFDKTIQVEGSGIASPLDNAVCSVVIEAKNIPEANNRYTTETVIRIGEGDSDLELFVDQCLITMRAGEVAVFESRVPLDEADGPCIIMITINHFENPANWPLMTNGQKYESAIRHKQIGVELFKKDRIKNAFRHFSKATKYLLLVDRSMEVPDQLNTTLSQCYLNLAACQLKVSSAAEDVITNCSKALLLDRENVKGYARRGQAYLVKGDYSAAAQDFKRGLQQSSNNTFIQNLLKKAQEGQRTENKKLSSGMSQMFNSGT